MKSYWDRKIVTSVIFSSRSLQTSKFYCVISMDHKGSDSFLISFRGVNWLLNGSCSSYLNNRNLTNINLTSSHGSFKRLNKDSRQKQWMWSIHFLVSPCSQNPQSSHHTIGTLSLEWTHCRLSLEPPSYQTWCCHNNHSRNPWQTHHLSCFGP
jgi:hypothetical protein